MKDYMTIMEAAIETGVSPQRIAALLERDEISGVLTGNGREYVEGFVKTDDVRWIADK